jgi:hypothetical protein
MKSIIFLFAFVVTIFFLLLFGSHKFVINDEGYHAGYVTAVERRGVFAKNYTVYIKTDNSSSQEDQYCVEASNRKLIEGLRNEARQKRKIGVFYNSNWTVGIITPLCDGDEITRFEVLK